MKYAALQSLRQAARLSAWMSSAALTASLLMSSALVAPAAADRFEVDTSRMPGFKVVTAESGRLSAPNMVVVEYEGPIAFPMAENLRAVWDTVRLAGRFDTFVLRLNSAGGVGEHGEQVISVLGDIRAQATVNTLVGDDDLCGSMCIGIFIQGERRYASPASSWMFHGASRIMSNIPDIPATNRYFGLFTDRDIDRAFIGFLYGNNYLMTPGAYWMSGSELAAVSNIVTDLLPNWRPADPQHGPAHMVRGGI